MSRKRELAKSNAQFYFRLLAKKSGLHWDNDNVTEIDEMIDAIIDAAKEEIKDEMDRVTKK